MQQLRIHPNDAKAFARDWKHNGVSLVVDDPYLNLMADFATAAVNHILQNLAAQQAEARKPKVVLGE